MHHIADKSCSHPHIPPPLEAHTLFLVAAHSGGKKSYSCTVVSQVAFPVVPPALGVTKEIEKKECLLFGDGG